MILKDIRISRVLDLDKLAHIRFGAETGASAWRVGSFSSDDLVIYNTTSSLKTTFGSVALTIYSSNRDVVISSTSEASVTTGALRVNGGILATKAIYTNSTTAATSSGGGSIVSTGGMSIDKDIRRKAGTSTVYGTAPVVIYSDITAIGNTGTGEDTLISLTVAGNVLTTNGDRLRITAPFVFAANANTKRVRAYFGSTECFDSNSGGANTFNGMHALVTAIITRTGAATQNITVAMTVYTAGPGPTMVPFIEFTAATETLSSANAFYFTGEATADNDISQKEMVIEYLPAP